MLLLPGGIDVFYIDESVRTPLFVASAVTVPFLREGHFGWSFVWPHYYQRAELWRRNLSKTQSIIFRKELHAYDLLNCKGLYHKRGRNLSTDEAVETYTVALKTADFLPEASIITTYATADSAFAGATGVDVCLLTLFQRMRSQCEGRGTNGIVFFDEGHHEYIHAFRKAQKYLPTGSSLGGWGGRATRNIPLDMFPKDANFKSSRLSYFVQIADLVAYAARVKLESEMKVLSEKRVRRGHHKLYDALPSAMVNLKATRRRTDGLAAI